MSGVSTKISVLDAMTPAIEHMYRATSQLISGMHKLNQATGNAVDMGPFLEAQKSMAEAVVVQKQLAEGSQRVSEEYKQVKDYTEQAETAQRRYNNSLSQGINRATAFGDRLTSGIKRYITMAAGAYGGKQLIDASDTWTNNSARLGLITDNLQQQRILQQQIYQSAKDARGVYSDTVDVTAKLGLLAGDAFNNNNELVRFTELMNKSFKVGGAGTQERQSAMYQLTQAMASGRLQGDEFRSIMENAPILADAIATFTGKSKGELKEMSSEGTITADIIKNALFSAADDIESKFSTLPMTFSDTWTNIASDATMAFEPLYTRMNDMLNSDFVKGIISEIPDLFEQVSLRGQEMLSVIESSAIVAGPGLSELANSTGSVADAMFSANGAAGSFIRTIGQIASNPATADSIRTIGGSLILVANAFNTVMQVATPLLPIITQGYVAFKMYNTVEPIMNTVATGVAGVVNVTTTMTSVIRGATTAQEGLNAVMTANPYLGVASAIAKVVAMMVSLIGAIKAANEAAGLAEDSSNEYSYNNVSRINDISSKYGVDRKTAQQLDSTWDVYNTAVSNNETARQAAYDKWFKDNNDTMVKIGYGVNKAGKELEDYMIENAMKTGATSGLYNITQQYDANKASLLETARAEHDFLYESYKQRLTVRESLNNISTDPNDYMKDFSPYSDSTLGSNLNIDNVDNVNHINDTVDIASEDLRFMRELAEQEAINQFTSKLLQPQINVTFGEVKETADVDSIIQRITDGLVENLNNSGDVIHI